MEGFILAGALALWRAPCLQVSIEDAKKALNEQYGGEDENPPPGTGFNTFKFTKYSNAYMLVYVRTSDWNRVRPLSRSCRLTSSETWTCRHDQ